MSNFKNLIYSIPRVSFYIFWIIVVLLTLFCYQQYLGRGYIYLVFTLAANGLLYLGFRKKALFFDAALGAFLWLGFWLKLTVRVAFYQSEFIEFSTGNFDRSGAAFDHGLLVVSCGLLGLIAATLIREKFFFYSNQATVNISQPGLLQFYRKNRNLILVIFILLSVGVALSNVYLGIYQRGMVPLSVLPAGLSGIYKWLLLFGLASLGAVLLQFEYVNQKSNSYVVAILVLLEGALSNISMLSRGMILNSTAEFYGLFKSLKSIAIGLKFRLVIVVLVMFLALFVGSVFTVNYLRYSAPVENAGVLSGFGKVTSSGVMASQTHSLFVDRWVGIEGVLAVSSSEKLGWSLWRDAWGERYKDNGTSFYDLNLIKSPYLTADIETHHYISLPGVIAFCFYPGSFVFLFVCMLILGLGSAFVEFATYKMGGGNLILCSLFAEVVAFRLTSFGYVPAQSYLLFGSLFLNLIAIYWAERLLSSHALKASRV